MLEYLNGITGQLPKSVVPTLGPDATGLGWVYQYALEDTTGRLSLAELRGLQDWHIHHDLISVPGVAEVATIGGYEKQYQVDLDPAKLLAYRIPVTRVMSAIQNANADVGAMVMELSEREYMVRGLGYLIAFGHRERCRGRYGLWYTGACGRAGPCVGGACGAPRRRRIRRTRRRGWWHRSDAIR